MSYPTSTQLQLSVPRPMGNRASKPTPDMDNRRNTAAAPAPKEKFSEEDKKRLEKYGFYLTDQKLGEGNYGEIFSCLYKSRKTGFKTHLACKKISPFSKTDYDDPSRKEQIISRIARETAVIQYIINNSNDNILKTNIIVQHFKPNTSITQSFNYIILMEVADDDLEDFVWEFSRRTTIYSDVHGLSESDVKKLIKQIASGVDFLHNAAKRQKCGQERRKITIVHRDIKPDNVFFIIQNGEEILSDLTVDTPNFYGPEMINPRQWLDKKRGYDPRVTNDVYAIGATAFYCWIGMGEGRDKDFIYDGIDWMKDDKWDLIKSEFSQLSRQFCQFLQGCCNLDPKKRFNLEKCINDPWLKDVKDVKNLKAVKEFPESVEKYRKIREKIFEEMPLVKSQDRLEELKQNGMKRQGKGS